MIPWFKPHFFGDEKANVCEALDSTWISDGSFIEQFEARITSLLQCENFICTSNGTASLHLALMALDVQPEDEVIIPGYTFAAPANMVINAGATPVFADVDPQSWLLDARFLESKITAKTKAIIPVHLYGNVCDMEPIIKIARKFKLKVIEDTAESFLSSYKGKFAGSIGDIGSFSFQATKTITTGEGGGVAIQARTIAEKAKLYRSHGMSPGKRYWHEVAGHNFRLTNLQAALGCAQLDHIGEIIENKKRIDSKYRQNLASVSGLFLQEITVDCEHVMWAFALCIDESVISLTRDEIIEKLKQRGVECRPGFTSFSRMPLYPSYPTPNADKIARTLLSLPSFIALENSEIDYICNELLDVLEGH